MLTGSQGRRRARTEAQREAYNAYQRRYRAEHKDKVQAWQRAYIVRKAARLADEQRQALGGGGDDARA